MFEQQPLTLEQKVKVLATESIKQQNPSGWFETLYAKADGNITEVPWAKNRVHPYLEDWLAMTAPQVPGKSALVIGCGLGDDAEALANCGYQVTAFDIAPTAIAWCQQRFPESSVTYLVADLFALDSSWQHRFDLVYECRNIQALPLDVRSQVIGKISSLVADQGRLLVITRLRDRATVPDGPPWAVSDQELSLFQELGLEEISRLPFVEEATAMIKQLRVEYRLHYANS